MPTLPQPFSSPSGLVFTTAAVMWEGVPILLVTRDLGDGAWQFVNGHGRYRGRDEADPGAPAPGSLRLTNPSRVSPIRHSAGARGDKPDADWIRDPRPSE